MTSAGRIVVLCFLLNAAGMPSCVFAEEWAPGPRAKSLAPSLRRLLAKVLVEKFGKPDAPAVWDALPVEYGSANEGTGDEAGWQLRAGGEVFAARCAGCHGSSGDGAGNAAAALDPSPRDFRLGVFKWTSLKRKERVLRHDLRETLRIGVPGTAMPAFPKLAPRERDAVVEYVRWLSMRGEFEAQLAFRLFDYDDARDVRNDELAELLEEALEPVARAWRSAELEDSILRPGQQVPSSAASIARGRKLYLSASACFKCHGEDGRGTVNAAGRPLLMKDAWGKMVGVDDLNRGIFRGGAAPADVYRRVLVGIDGSPMPSCEQILQEDQVWDLVNYLLSLRPKKLDARLSVMRREPPPGLDRADGPNSSGKSERP